MAEERPKTAEQTDRLTRLVLALSATLLTLLIVGLIGAGVIYLSKMGVLHPGYALTVRFPDAQGVSVGAPVRMAGVAVGSVTRATTMTGREADVDLSIYRNSRIPRGSRFVIASPLLDPPGGVRILAPRASDNSGGTIAPGAAGLTGESGVDLTATLAQASVLMAQFDQTSRRADALMTDAARAARRIDSLIQTVNAAAPKLRRDLDRTSANFQAVSQNARVMTQDGAQITRQLKTNLPQTQARARVVLKNATDASAQLSALVKENRAQIRAILADVRKTSAVASDLSAKTSTLLQSPRTAKLATDMTDDLRATLGSLKSSSAHLDTLAANGAKLSDDPAVQADLKSTLRSLAQSTEKAAALLDKTAALVDLLTKAAQAKKP